ncbi:MAG: hypothetical protein JST92_18615 [Deltaproteobacteria bacterium]|nr:hypothetical protein [Deltaproteobacteria bacterium]
MSVRRERVDPAPTSDKSLLVHRRWFIPDDLSQPVPPQALAKLWRALFTLEFLNPSDEVTLQRVALPAAPGTLLDSQDLPAMASAGALLAGTDSALLVTQMVWLERERRQDPFAVAGVSDPAGYRDSTLHVVTHPGFVLLPVPAKDLLCAGCGQPSDATEGALKFGEAMLFPLARACPHCKRAVAPESDKVVLRSGQTFLFSEAAAKVALSIELIRAPQSEELPHAGLVEALEEAFGGFDELVDDQVAPSR